jgi:hypothetical protein
MKEEVQLCLAAMRNAPAPNVSSSYSFFPTSDVVESLRSVGYLVSGSNQQGKTDYGIHVVRMRHESFIDEKLAPEIVIKNASNGYSPLHLMSGLYRMVCSNGLIVGSSHSEVKLFHRKGTTMDAVFDGVKYIVEQTDLAIERSTEWSKIKMEHEARAHFTQMVGTMLKKDGNLFMPDELLKRRYDEEYNLWTCFNLAQESIIKGGIRTTRGNQLRGISGAARNVDVNRGLWQVAEEFAALS